MPHALSSPILDRVARVADDQAFEDWRDLLSPIVRIIPSPAGTARPRGSLSSFRVGDLMLTRMVIDPQVMVRDKRLADATPDHFALQTYRIGGFSGTVAGRPLSIARGTVAVVDLRRPFETRFPRSDTVGLAVPRRLMARPGQDWAHPLLDPARNRLLAARVASLYRDLSSPPDGAQPDDGEALLTFLHRLFDASAAPDALGGCELDAGVVALAEGAITAGFRSPELDPSAIAASVGVSRATLYRAFAARGGVMRAVWDARLDAVRSALEDPLETRSLARLASTHGFKQVSHLSRSFRARFGATPRDWRMERRRQAQPMDRPTIDRMRASWFDIA